MWAFYAFSACMLYQSLVQQYKFSRRTSLVLKSLDSSKIITRFLDPRIPAFRNSVKIHHKPRIILYKVQVLSRNTEKTYKQSSFVFSVFAHFCWPRLYLSSVSEFSIRSSCFCPLEINNSLLVLHIEKLVHPVFTSKTAVFRAGVTAGKYDCAMCSAISLHTVWVVMYHRLECN